MEHLDFVIWMIGWGWLIAKFDFEAGVGVGTKEIKKLDRIGLGMKSIFIILWFVIAIKLW